MAKAAVNNKITATAKGIQQSNNTATGVVVFLSNAVLFAIAVAGWCMLKDIGVLGYFDLRELINNVSRRFDFSHFLENGRIFVDYIVTVKGHPPVTVDATAFFLVLIAAVFLFATIEAIFFSIARAVTLRRTNTKLKPLYRLAEAAQQLDREDYSVSEKRALDEDKSASGSFETERIHSLENAIDNLKPDRPDAAIHTGDKDLAGLEDSINSLLTRTRDSYSQQIRFVSDASHELRTPIAVIKGYTDMLDRWGKEDEKVLGESIDAIKAETDHMNKLVEQLLFLARGDSGRNKLTIERFSLTDLVREVYDESVMIDENHRWRLSADTPVSACGDISMLKQAVRILVDNAAKYTEKDETITLKAEYSHDGTPAVVVQDNGIGIKNSDIPHVFERFYRSDESRSKKQSGTGLGLAIAKWIVDRHNGYFEVLSREEFGTRITIHLPKSLPLTPKEREETK